MKNLKIGAALVGLTLLAVGCKKGENDPFLSLKTRKARLCQEWSMETGSGQYLSGTQGQFNGSDEGIVEIKDGVRTEKRYNNDSLILSRTGKFEQTLIFNKDYTFERHEISYYENGNLQYDEVTRGSWAFVGQSKDEDFKNKERISIIETYYAYKSYEEDGSLLNDYSYSGSEIDYSEFMTLDRLSSKDLSIISNGEGTFTTDTYTSTFKRTQQFNYKRN